MSSSYWSVPLLLMGVVSPSHHVYIYIYIYIYNMLFAIDDFDCQVRWVHPAVTFCVAQRVIVSRSGCTILV